ncbi:hypothetical protein IE53DRAFT_259594 [Violaceomyces palustris]|uniref:Uncharacterized protein n=1 Tax=Violaceomyces palustris TaxID=1673888 RepID=A0ACD0NN58_9BASI|nr:hypothetical protein IE53DRAFT_259594 [Violaceomyces palustris]
MRCLFSLFLFLFFHTFDFPHLQTSCSRIASPHHHPSISSSHTHTDTSTFHFLHSPPYSLQLVRIPNYLRSLYLEPLGQSSHRFSTFIEFPAFIHLPPIYPSVSSVIYPSIHPSIHTYIHPSRH